MQHVVSVIQLVSETVQAVGRAIAHRSSVPVASTAPCACEPYLHLGFGGLSVHLRPYHWPIDFAGAFDWVWRLAEAIQQIEGLPALSLASGSRSHGKEPPQHFCKDGKPQRAFSSQTTIASAKKAAIEHVNCGERYHQSGKHIERSLALTKE